VHLHAGPSQQVTVAALGLVVLVRRRGAWLANVAGLLAILGISTIPGFLMIDFVDSAIGRITGVDVALRVSESAMAFWGFFVMQIPGLAGEGYNPRRASGRGATVSHLTIHK